MTANTLNCYVIPSLPLPILLPTECVAAIVENPDIELLKDAKTTWMSGYLIWDNQRIPVMSYQDLIAKEKLEADDRERTVVVLNPIPGAARKALSGLVCLAGVEKIDVAVQGQFVEIPAEVDKRYVEAAIDIEGVHYLVPKLTAIGVAFSYF